MYHSLQKLASLAPETKVYCGHEYTLNNLLFAQSVEPENGYIKDKLEWAKVEKSTIPSTIAQELLTNPFMRVNEKSLSDRFNINDPIEMMGHLRSLKNKF
jgi:hydroxyacylglutathione hydrolase